MDYFFETLKKMALEAVKNQDPNLGMGVAVMSNFGRNYSCTIRNIYDSDDQDAFLQMLVSKGESRLSLVVCAKSDGSICYPTRSLCRDIDRIHDGNSMGVDVYCPTDDGGVKKRFLAALLREL